MHVYLIEHKRNFKIPQLPRTSTKTEIAFSSFLTRMRNIAVSRESPVLGNGRRAGSLSTDSNRVKSGQSPLFKIEDSLAQKFLSALKSYLMPFFVQPVKG